MRPPPPTPLAVGALLVALAALAGCAAAPEVRSAEASEPTSSARTEPAVRPAAAPEPATRLQPSGPQTSDGAPRAATLTVPQIGLRDFPVRPYRGTTDDAAGTVIQDAGDLASPYGPDGGVGPGGVGNYLVTGHRLSSTEPFLDLPALERGDRFTVTTAQRVFTYEVRATRETSFREPASLAAQRAAVPGRPGMEPTRAMVTLSTCATPEDHAAGNYWSDANGNPEHRIDKIGVLVESQAV